jgi:UDP-glucose:(heptosyl)LPS alpha-1,3-glucosyltransferase
MKLAIVCRPFSFHGGVETSTAGFIAEMVRRGHRIDLLTTPGQSDVPGVEVRRLRVIQQPSILRLLSFALAARRAAARAGYEIVQSHERSLRQDVYRAGEGTHRGYMGALGRVRASPYHRVVYMLENRTFRLISARHIVAISKIGKAEIERLFGTPASAVTVIYNGVDLERFHPDNRSRWCGIERDALGIDASTHVVLFVGSGFERKGLAPLIDAMSRAGDRRSRLVVAGKGDTRRYRDLAGRLGIDSRISWLAPRPDIERLYALADVVALPALYEPFGNVHLEALASGVPVITSARAGGAEVVTAGQTGWIVAEPTGAAIAEGLAALRDSDAARVRQAARGAAEPFTYRAQAEEYERLYRRLGR